MGNEFLDALGKISEKLKNNYQDDSTLERTQCLVKNELKIISNIWQITFDEALILSAIVIKKVNKNLFQCSFSDISIFLGISNLELIKYYQHLLNLEERGLILKEPLDFEKPVDNVRTINKHLIQSSINELGFQYLLSEKILKKLFN